MCVDWTFEIVVVELNLYVVDLKPSFGNIFNTLNDPFNNIRIVRYLKQNKTIYSE